MAKKNKTNLKSIGSEFVIRIIKNGDKIITEVGLKENQEYPFIEEIISVLEISKSTLLYKNYKEQ